MLSTNTPTRPMLRRFLLCSAAGIVLAPAPLVAQSTSSTGQANSASIASTAVQPNPVQQAAPPAEAAGAGEPADPIAAAAQDVGEALQGRRLGRRFLLARRHTPTHARESARPPASPARPGV